MVPSPPETLRPSTDSYVWACGLLGHSFSGSVPNLLQPLALVHFSLGEKVGEVLSLNITVLPLGVP